MRNLAQVRDLSQLDIRFVCTVTCFIGKKCTEIAFFIFKYLKLFHRKFLFLEDDQFLLRKKITEL